MSEHHDLCPCVDPDAINPTCDCVALDVAGVKRGRALGRVVVAEDEQASDERGAWTCGACGFRGFWRGGPHCADGVKEDGK